MISKVAGLIIWILIEDNIICRIYNSNTSIIKYKIKIYIEVSMNCGYKIFHDKILFKPLYCINYEIYSNQSVLFQITLYGWMSAKDSCIIGWLVYEMFLFYNISVNL